MKTFIQHGDCLTVLAPAGGTTSGELYKVGAIVGVAATTELVGAPVVLKLDGVFGLTKTSAQAWAVGDLLFMNTTTRVLTNVSATGLVLVGMATEVAANPSATGACRLNGVSAPAPV
jgi:predicted RecA/RadA family phage recombinase